MDAFSWTWEIQKKTCMCRDKQFCSVILNPRLQSCFQNSLLRVVPWRKPRDPALGREHQLWGALQVAWVALVSPVRWEVTCYIKRTHDSNKISFGITRDVCSNAAWADSIRSVPFWEVKGKLMATGHFWPRSRLFPLLRRPPASWAGHMQFSRPPGY